MTESLQAKARRVRAAEAAALRRETLLEAARVSCHLCGRPDVSADGSRYPAEYYPAEDRAGWWLHAGPGGRQFCLAAGIHALIASEATA